MARRLDELRGGRVNLDPLGLGLGLKSRLERNARASPLFLYDVGQDSAVAHLVRVSGTTCGCSSMAEHQLPKLTVRVRFPSSALMQRPRSEADSEHWPFVVLRVGRAVVPLGGHERPG